MSKAIKKWEIWGAAITIIAGSLLHFVYSWSGSNKVAAIFAAVNESTWEHLKLAFWPTLLIAIIELIFLQKNVRNFFLAAMVKLLSMPIIIVGLFYAWLAFLPDNLIWDISIFIIAVILGYYFSAKIMSTKNDYQLGIPSLALIIIAIVAFSIFTYHSPKMFLFKDPVTGNYGLPFN